MNDYRMIIAGKAVEGAEGTFEVIEPATGKAFARCAAASPAQLDDAVVEARRAFAQWRMVSHAQRCEILRSVATDIEAEANGIAQLIVREQGKPMALAMSEVMGGVAWTRYHAEQRMPVEIIEDSAQHFIELQRKPLGVVGSITPWNWPFMIAIWHIMPALRAGNTVISKPSSLTPLSTVRLVEIIARHVPAGVISVITGVGGLGGAMTRHADINKIVFTGSTQTGQRVMRESAGNLKRLTLELGGNDAAIVLPGSDVDAIAPQIFQAAFLNMGQTCAALKRLYVHRTQYQAFCDALVTCATASVIGNGLDAEVDFGPVQNLDQLTHVEALVSAAHADGATVLCGGARLERDGFFYPPTIVADVYDGSRLVDEEQFGPVLPVIVYDDVEEALKNANASEFGLGGSVWGADADAASAVAERLESGVAWVNCHAQIRPDTPFGGSKMSGYGVEFGMEGLLEFTGQQLVFRRKE